MKPTWIVENFNGDDSYKDIIKEVKRQEMECIVLDISNHFELKSNMVKEGECVIFQGSIQLFRKLKKELFVKPLGWMTDENYLCSRYYPHFQKYLFNDKHVLMSVASIKHNKWWVYGAFGKETMIYVRPDGGDKLFPGKLLDLQDFDRFWGNDTLSGTKDTDLIVVSSPKNINGEWRYIVTDKKEILGVSTYKYRGQRTYIPSAPESATKVCKDVLDVGWYPDPIFTVDIAEDNDGNFWLVELNSFTSAGTYAANKENLIRRVSEIAVEEYEHNNRR